MFYYIYINKRIIDMSTVTIICLLVLGTIIGYQMRKEVEYKQNQTMKQKYERIYGKIQK